MSKHGCFIITTYVQENTLLKTIKYLDNSLGVTLVSFTCTIYLKIPEKSIH